MAQSTTSYRSCRLLSRVHSLRRVALSWSLSFQNKAAKGVRSELVNMGTIEGVAVRRNAKTRARCVKGLISSRAYAWPNSRLTKDPPPIASIHAANWPFLNMRITSNPLMVA
jgi:hypothetical protein